MRDGSRAPLFYVEFSNTNGKRYTIAVSNPKRAARNNSRTADGVTSSNRSPEPRRRAFTIFVLRILRPGTILANTPPRSGQSSTEFVGPITDVPPFVTIFSCAFVSRPVYRNSEQYRRRIVIAVSASVPGARSTVHGRL